MSYQTIFNPYTGQIKVIDLSQSSAQQQIMSLYQQGWRSGPPPVSVSTMKTSVPTATPAIPPAVNEDAYYQQMYGMTKQQWINTPTHTEIVGTEIRPVSSGGGVEDIKVYVPAGYTKGLTNLGPGAKKKIVEQKSVSLDEYNKLLREGKDVSGYSIKPTKLSKAEASKMGQGVLGYTAEMQPTILEKVAGVAETVAIMAVPLYDTVKNWNNKDTKAKVISLGLDALAVIPSAWFATRTVSATVRAGGTVRAGVQTAIKNEILAPFYMLRHPIQTFKAPFVTLKEFAGKKYVPYEGVIGSIKAPAGRVGMSDVRMRVGAGQEERGATREAMEALQRQVVAGELKPSTMQGLSKVELTPTGIQQTLGDGISLSGSPAFENYLTALEATGKVSKGKIGLKGAMLGKETDILSPGHILVQGREGGIYTAGTGTLFHKGAATGGIGQISVQLAIDTAGKGLGELPKAVGKYQDISQMHKAGLKVLGAGKADDALVPGFKIYAGTAEGEMVVQNLEKLYAVPSGKLTTFKWNIPEPTLMKKAESMRDALKASLVELGEAKRAGASSTRLKALEDKATELAEQALKTEKEAIKKGTPKSVTLDIDHVKIIDPMTGEETIVAHFAVEGAKVKPWTQAQINALKRRGYLNIPRDITTPALKYPHMTPEEQFSLVRNNLKPSEQARLDAGVQISTGFRNQQASTAGLMIDLKKVDVLKDMPDKTINSIENVFRGYKDKTRLHGSLVEQTYTGKTIAGDLDVAADMGIMQDATKKVAKAIENAGYKTRIRMISAEQGLGGAGFGVDFYKDGKWVKAVDFRDMVEHKKLLAYGMQTHDAVPINGIYLETPREMLNRRFQVVLMPGFGLQGAEHIGPQAAFKLNRMKDIPRAQMLTDNLLDAMHAEAMGLSGEARQAKLAEESRLRQAARTLFGDTPTPRLNGEYDDYFKNFLKASDDIDVYDTIRQIENRVQMPYDKRYKGPLSNLASVRATNTAMRNILTVADGEYRGLRAEGVTPSRMELVRDGRLQRDGRVNTEGRIPRDERIERTEREEVVPREERVDRIERPPVEPRITRPSRDERVPDEPRIPRPPRDTRIPDTPREPRPPRDERIPDEPRPPRRGRDKGGDASLEIERVEGIPRNPGIIRWNKGVVQVEIVPPYREGSEDIRFTGLKQPQRGKGSQERTLTVVKGQAPKLVVLGRQGGIAKTHIIRGKKMKHIRQIIRQRGPGVIDSRGNLHKQRRGSVI